MEFLSFASEFTRFKNLYGVAVFLASTQQKLKKSVSIGDFKEIDIRNTILSAGINACDPNTYTTLDSFMFSNGCFSDRNITMRYTKSKPYNQQTYGITANAATVYYKIVVNFKNKNSSQIRDKSGITHMVQRNGMLFQDINIVRTIESAPLLMVQINADYPDILYNMIHTQTESEIPLFRLKVNEIEFNKLDTTAKQTLNFIVDAQLRMMTTLQKKPIFRLGNFVHRADSGMLAKFVGLTEIPNDVYKMADMPELSPF